MNGIDANAQDLFILISFLLLKLLFLIFFVIFLAGFAILLCNGINFKFLGLGFLVLVLDL